MNIAKDLITQLVEAIQTGSDEKLPKITVREMFWEIGNETTTQIDVSKLYPKIITDWKVYDLRRENDRLIIFRVRGTEDFEAKMEAKLILPFNAKWDFEKVRNLTYNEHPTYDFSIYEPFPGFADITNIQFLSATGILAIGVYGIPTCCFLLTRRVLTLIKYHQNMSEKTKKQARTLINGLTVQTILPVLAYIPTFTCYLITQTYNIEILFSEHLILISASSPSLLDPLITFYFIIPYRSAIIQIFRRGTKSDARKSTVISVSVSTSAL